MAIDPFGREDADAALLALLAAYLEGFRAWDTISV